jgi:hypothetical protein
MLVKRCSENVSYMLAETPTEIAGLQANIPRAVAQDLERALDREGAVLRHDAPTKCAYLIERRDGGAISWVWCDLGLKASSQLLTLIAALGEPMTETTALNLYDLATGHN